eukprot:2717947-Prymnesium_polylepis.1
MTIPLAPGTGVSTRTRCARRARRLALVLLCFGTTSTAGSSGARVSRMHQCVCWGGASAVCPPSVSRGAGG